MKLVAAVESYIALRRSLGSVFDAESRILRCFGSSLGEICLDGIDPTCGSNLLKAARDVAHSFKL